MSFSFSVPDLLFADCLNLKASSFNFSASEAKSAITFWPISFSAVLLVDNLTTLSN